MTSDLRCLLWALQFVPGITNPWLRPFFSMSVCPCIAEAFEGTGSGRGFHCLCANESGEQPLP